VSGISISKLARDELEAGRPFFKRQEWRIFTVMDSHITVLAKNAYKVKVTCDYEFSVVCPTIDRAIEMMLVLEGQIMALWGLYGWPSWTSKTHMRTSGFTDSATERLGSPNTYQPNED
jgi:hypothetical protein